MIVSNPDLKRTFALPGLPLRQQRSRNARTTQINSSSMKCAYEFSVAGRIRPSANVPIPARGWLFEYKTSPTGLVTHLCVTVPLPDRNDWPTATKNPESGAKLHLNVKTPHLPFIQRQLRAIQGLLSMYGLRSIDLEQPEVRWLPESDEERAALAMYSFKRQSEPVADHEVPRLSFDLLARSVLAADSAETVEVPLNFFRRGMIDVYERNYIEAIYDFYFILETVYGEGKFKKAAVMEAFCRSDELRAAVRHALDDPGRMIGSDPQLRARFQREYGGLSLEAALEKIIDVRGYLHHHTQKRPQSWHPDEQRQFETEALLLQGIAFNVVFELSKAHLWSEAVSRAYEELVDRHSSTEPRTL